MKTSITTALRHVAQFLGAILFAGTLTVPAIADEQPQRPLTMIVMQDTAYGGSISAGNYERAISKLTAAAESGRDKFAIYNNLCVAYAKARKLDAALEACDAALEAVMDRGFSNRAKNRSYDSLYAQYEADLAVALSNRGVLLAVEGNNADAAQAFEDALGLDTKYSSNIEGNLIRLATRAVPDPA